MNCRVLKSKLSAYIDRELSGRDMLEIRDHLAQCAECQHEYRALTGIKQCLGSLAAPAPSYDFEDRLLTAVAKSAPQPDRRLSTFSLALVSGVAALFLVLTVLKSVDGGTTVEQVQPVAAADVQSDQMIHGAYDPFGSAPVVTVSHAGR